jgi:putative ABC transport system permease protein
VLVFTVAAALVCGVLFGLAPALGAARTTLTEAMKEGAREGSDRRSRLRSALMVAQVALAVLLLTGAGLFVHSLRNVQAVDPGFDVAHLVHASLDLGSVGFPDSAIAPFYDRALERVLAVPGVTGATLVSSMPLSGSLYSRGYTIPGRPARSDDAQASSADGQDALTYDVGPDYFTTVGTPIRRGRDFTTADRKGSQPVSIVNEAFATREFPSENPIGKCIDIGHTCFVVVGVVANACSPCPG